MLEGVAIVGYIIVVVVGVGKEVVTRGKDVAGRQVGSRQVSLLWVLDDEEVFGIVGEVLAQLIAQIGICIAVTDNLDGIGGTDATMVGGDDDTIVALCQLAEKVGHDRMAEP